MFFLPSRSRPDKVAKLAEAFVATGATAPVLLRLDADDPTLPDYMALDLPPSWKVEVGERPEGGGSAKLIREFYAHYPALPWYGLLADDVTPISPGWDQKLIDAAGSHRLAYGPDGLVNKMCATHPVIGGALVRAIGWIAMPGVRHYFVDIPLFQIAQRAGLLTYVEDAKLFHANAPQMSRNGWSLEDRKAFHVFQSEEMDALVAKLRATFPCDEGLAVRCLSVVSVIPDGLMTHFEWTLSMMRIREFLGMEGIGYQFMFFLAPITKETLIRETVARSPSSTHVFCISAQSGFDAEAVVRDLMAAKWNDTLFPIATLVEQLS